VSDLPGLDVLALPGMRAALAQRDIATAYKILTRHGVSQRQIAHLTGQSQSEVCEILQGRRVQAYDLLLRIATGLGIPREGMGLGQATYPEDSASEPGEVDEDVLRRRFHHLLALAGMAAFGVTVPGVGEPSTFSLSGRFADTPSRIGKTDVQALRDLTRAVADSARTVGGQAGPATALAGWADVLLAAQASDAARKALFTALADLHVIAAWCCHDSAAPIAAHHHFALAVDLATQAGDSYRACYALRHAAMMLIDRDEPNNALKLVQLAEVRLIDAPREDPRVAPLRSWLAVESALARSRMVAPGDDSAARPVLSELARARDGWAPLSPHARADFDLVTALAYLHLGKLDTAESMAAVSVKTFAAGSDRREGVLADVTLARLHVQTGEPDAVRLAADAVQAVIPTRSSIARAALEPLAVALETRPRSDLRELARTARQVASTRT
jgi:transcriptional regulator with XRE-family HTH domain